MEYTKNQILEIKIEDITNEGEGVGKVDGFAFFVKDTLVGDYAKIRVTKVKKNYGYGRLEELIKPSEYRVDAPCPIARACGGCQIQSLSYKEQLRFKTNKVRNNLIRLGGFEASLIDKVMEPIIGMEENVLGTKAGFRYRNKAQYPVGYSKDGELIVGFYAGRTHSIVANKDCLLGCEENAGILDIILNWMKENDVKAYDETSQSGIVRHILIRKGFHSNDVMVCLVVNSDKLPQSNALIEKLSKVSGMKSISISTNKKNTNVIMGESYRTLWGEDTISDTLLGLEYHISPLSFYQVNPIQVEKLYSTAIEFADINENDEVWDLCCGIGTITLSMASKAGKVHGIEIVPEAIEDARANAINNNIFNADFVCAPVEVYFPTHKESLKADVVVMDPPRKGMDEKTLRVVADMSPSRIVYVSCDSATLARDLKFLCNEGYQIQRVRPCDMFPQTVHVETVCLLSRK